MIPKRSNGPDPDELARRLNLLLDHVEAVRGEPYTFSEVSEYLASKGVSLSRARWSYMLNGGRWRVRDAGLLAALADLFDVDVAYLEGSGDLPSRVVEEMDMIRGLRRARFHSFGVRNFGDTDPEALRAIEAYLDGREELPS